MADAQRGLRGLFPRIDSASRGGKHLAQRDFLAGHILGLEFVQVSSDEASEERGGDVIGMTLCSALVHCYVGVWVGGG